MGGQQQHDMPVEATNVPMATPPDEHCDKPAGWCLPTEPWGPQGDGAPAEEAEERRGRDEGREGARGAGHSSSGAGFIADPFTFVRAEAGWS